MGSVIAKRRERWEPFMGGEKPQMSDVAGKVGLKNMGNSCFMNAGLQCLSHLEPFVAYFLTGKYKEELNVTNPSGSKGEFAAAFAELQKALWQRNKQAYRPDGLRAVLARRAPHLFEGFEQQDVQEFLAFCLDELHEDLNRVQQRPPPKSEEEEAADEKRFAQLGEEFVAALAWMQYLEHGKSFLVDLFQGQQRSSLTCRTCGHQARRFEPFLYLSVPVQRGGKMRHVTDAIEKYLEAEELVGEERWLCPKCNRKVNARKKIDIWKLPPVLVLHLKRFEFDPRTLNFKKIDARLSAPLTLDLSGYVASPQKEHAVYDVVAVADHLGAYGAGHYTACCRVACEGAEAGEWCRFDDARVRPVEAKEVVTKDAYVMFLLRRAGEGQPIQRQSASLPEVWPHFVSTRNSAVLDVYYGRREPAGAAGLAAGVGLAWSSVGSKSVGSSPEAQAASKIAASSCRVAPAPEGSPDLAAASPRGPAASSASAAAPAGGQGRGSPQAHGQCP